MSSLTCPSCIASLPPPSGSTGFVNGSGCGAEVLTADARDIPFLTRSPGSDLPEEAPRIPLSDSFRSTFQVGRLLDRGGSGMVLDRAGDVEEPAPEGGN